MLKFALQMLEAEARQPVQPGKFSGTKQSEKAAQPCARLTQLDDDEAIALVAVCSSE